MRPSAIACVVRYLPPSRRPLARLPTPIMRSPFARADVTASRPSHPSTAPSTAPRPPGQPRHAPGNPNAPYVPPPNDRLMSFCEIWRNPRGRAHLVFIMAGPLFLWSSWQLGTMLLQDQPLVQLQRAEDAADAAADAARRGAESDRLVYRDPRRVAREQEALGTAVPRPSL
ncbi:hypothetical protein CXG81DRAFT_28380 [Caulochytrium protostelioides]|uniref:Uncharacterized protein n=1 Tax=Caulochytrium protostelioides TaxID=1555241 RepID=A0A4P9X1L0_9FUNG|nr:hypothetical protein CXG81DRAFT_28380 [Caulochytrium protostelioides]|eukprot:RKO98823.1 hypothetical protein CXG81DRAFT_28380 [Caulochytrium protostelioides]